jgi:hypothetical protein
VKRCSKCNQLKPESDYYKKRNGLTARCKSCHKTKQSKTAERTYTLKKYGLTIQQFNSMLAEQNHSCACCKRKEPGGAWNTWHVDHCHKTQKVRGLLCYHCNVGIGFLGDNLESILRAAAYLGKSND